MGRSMAILGFGRSHDVLRLVEWRHPLDLQTVLRLSGTSPPGSCAARLRCVRLPEHFPQKSIDSRKRRAYYPIRGWPKVVGSGSNLVTSRSSQSLFHFGHPFEFSRHARKMLRGNYTARIDAKGRLKVPTQFRRLIEEKHGQEFYITSLNGDCVRIYPLPEWESIEQRLSLLPTMDPARRRFLDRTNYYGQQATIDGQGRLLIHPLLRKSAGVLGDVAVLGYLSYLEVWELDRFKQRLIADPYTEEDEAAIARLGI